MFHDGCQPVQIGCYTFAVRSLKDQGVSTDAHATGRANADGSTALFFLVAYLRAAFVVYCCLFRRDEVEVLVAGGVGQSP